MTTDVTRGETDDRVQTLTVQGDEIRVLHAALNRQWNHRLKDAASLRKPHLARMALQDLRLLRSVMAAAGLRDLPPMP